MTVAGMIGRLGKSRLFLDVEIGGGCGGSFPLRLRDRIPSQQ